MGAFRRTGPSYYKQSKIKYIRQLEKNFFKVVIMNPCNTFFQNITNRESVNMQLGEECHRQFRAHTQLYNCRRAVPENPLMVNNNASPISPRPKRAVAGVLVAITLIVLTTTQAFSLYKTQVNEENLWKVKERIEAQEEFIKEGYTVMKELRQSIHELDERLTKVENTVTDIAHELAEYPRIAALISHYRGFFNEIGGYIRDIDVNVKHNRSSDAIFKLSRREYDEEPDEDLMTLESCIHHNDLNDRSLMAFSYDFVMPEKVNDIKIMKSESFMFWNYTTTKGYCWMQYNGPRYVMTNVTNNCQKEVQDFWITDDTISGHTCEQSNEELDPIKCE